jgi:hypothetical protein
MSQYVRGFLDLQCHQRSLGWPTMRNSIPTDDVGVSPKVPRAAWRYTAASIVFLLLLGIITEIMLRLTLGLGTPVIYQPDADAGYIAVPSQDVRRFGASIHINAFGMRSDDILPHKREGTYRVLFLGDSVAYGTTRVDQSEIFPSIVQRQLSTLVHEKVEVLNASTGGWAPSNELGFLRSRGTFESDLVVFTINTLDLNQPYTTQSDDQMAPYGNMPAHRPSSAVAELLIRYLLARIKGSLETHDPGSVESPVDPAKEVPPILDSLSKAKEFAQERGARFAILFTPQYFLVGRADWTLAKQMFLDWATAGNVPVLDMSPDFLSVPVSRYYLENIHPNSAGHALIARRLIENWPLLSGAAITGKHQGTSKYSSAL